MYVYLYADWIDYAEEAHKMGKRKKKAALHEDSLVDYLRALHYVSDLCIHVSFLAHRESTRVIEFD